MVTRSPTATGFVNGALASWTTCVSQNCSLPATAGAAIFMVLGLLGPGGERALKPPFDHRVAASERHRRVPTPIATMPNAATGRFVSRKGRFAMICSGFEPIPRKSRDLKVNSWAWAHITEC